MRERIPAWQWIAGAIVVFAVCLIGNNTVSLWDRDEPRYAQTSRQMLQSGDWVVPHFLDEVREKKPVFIYWCQAAAMAVLGDTAFAARLPSSIFVAITVGVLIWSMRWSVGRRRALWTGIIFATSGLTMASAKMSITDGVLILFVTVSQLCLYAIWRGRGSWGVFIILGLANGLGILTKGPVVIAVMAVTLIVLLVLRQLSPRKALTPALSQSTGRGGLGLKSLVSALIAFCVFAPWIYAIEQQREGYLFRTLREEVFLRIAESKEQHKGPPGYYVLSIALTFLPWTIFLPHALIRAWRRRSEPRIRFALAAIIGPWIMFELIQTKLPHYVLPIYPALAYLVADLLIAGRKSMRLPLALAGAMVIGVGVIYGLILPNITELRISIRVGEVLKAQGATKIGDVIMIKYKEPSLGFYQGGTIREESDNLFLQHHPAEQWPKWIVLTSDLWAATPPEIQQQLDVVATVHGINLANRLQPVDVMVLRKR